MPQSEERAEKGMNESYQLQMTCALSCRTWNGADPTTVKANSGEGRSAASHTDSRHGWKRKEIKIENQHQQTSLLGPRFTLCTIHSAHRLRASQHHFRNVSRGFLVNTME